MATDGYSALQAAVLRVLGLDLSFYKREQMERRLSAYAQQRGYGDLAGLARALVREPDLPAQMLSYLTIHVSEFFRDPRFFDDLRAILGSQARLPATYHAWSAGCSIGAEAYTLAILLSEQRKGQPFRITATDVDDKSLARARAGLYRTEEIRQVDDARRRRYFSAQEKEFLVDPDLRRNIEFRHHDLLRDPYPHDQDLILFRNVAIYFTEEAKLRVLRGLAQSLAPHGVLMVGSTEALLRPQEIGLRQLRPFFFRRAV